MIQPPALQPGDLIYITAPAKSIEQQYVDFATSFFEAKGFRVEVAKHCTGVHHYFSGTDEERAADVQAGIDHPEAKAIICARGGYGCVRIVDHLNWANMLREPKWMVGFSDITVFHQRLNRLGIESLHATMPLNYQTNSAEALETMMQHLTGTHNDVRFAANPKNKTGFAKGKIIGGNLSILYSLLATPDSYHFQDALLFIEDLCEHYYHLDRMLFALEKIGVFDRISALVVGGITDMEDTAVPFGMLTEEIVLQHFSYRKIPVCFDFPFGHIDDNRAIILGAEASLNVNSKDVVLSYIK